ncbi:hypothetical protein KIN20_013134 [Parelaphostrongylus tenuis]|uniref:GATA-type domain-containing protein n=1 Tax=Parelaphostrongylus tenuis TaxID=148309 RepID=A0AAD5MUA3_PARTN|nr:hypothetical protein KIN20_013134 [Parelaphostrongylus tenuis]
MAQGDEERNANKSNALFDYENVVVKEEEEEESLFGVVMGRKPEGTESNDASHEKEHDIEGTVKRCYNCRSRDIGRYVNGKHACKACQDYYKKYGENRPEYLCQRPIRRRVKNRDPGVFCYNCFDTRRDQKRWRRVKGMDACYSCGTYYHRTKADRPMALVHYSRSDQRKRWLGRRPQEEKRCYNCGVTNNAGEGWKRVDGKTSCSTCKHYRRKHPNEDRPEYLWRKAPRKEKTCYNCSFIIPKRGSYRVQGEVACSACKRYYVGTGRHRPEHLCRRPKKTQLRLLGTEGKCYNCPFILLKGIPRRQVEGKMSCCTCGHYYERTGQHRPEHLWRETLKKQERKATGNELRSDAVANVDDMKASGSSNSAPPCPRVDGDVDSGEIQSQRLTLWRLLGSLVEPHAAPLHRPHVNDDIDLRMMDSPIAQPVVDTDVKVNLGVHADTVMEGETFTPHCHQDEAAAWCAPLNPFQEIKIEELSNDDCN